MFIIYCIKIDGLHQLVLGMGVKSDMDFIDFDGTDSCSRSLG